MNILYLHSNPDLIGGSEKSMHLAALELKNIGHSVFLLHRQEVPPKSINDYSGALACESVFPRPVSNFERAKEEIRDIILGWGIDIIHIHELPPAPVLEWLGNHWPIVISVHTPMCPNGSRYFWREQACCERAIGVGCVGIGYALKGCGRLGNGKRWSFSGFLANAIEVGKQLQFLRGRSSIVANSVWSKDRLIKDQVPEGNIRIAFPPIEPKRKRMRYDPNGRPVLLFVGRLVEFKGADHLLRASTLIPHSHEIWIVGEGPVEGSLRRLALELGIAARVKFFGKLEGAALDEVRAKASIAVVPSLLPETFGMVGPEAMEMGLPVVAYRVGGIPEWLADGDTGVLVSPGNFKKLAAEITDLTMDPARLKRMGEKGIALASRYHVKNHARVLEDVYTETANKTSVPTNENADRLAVRRA